ncbi:MAG: 30S ribosomal protein S20 [Fimbriimonadaceae bacterium]|nr:30S ribosomal protein S20 [Fimbriimonadaceae bacterium]
MANIKSSKKDIKRSQKKAAQNQSVRTALKTYIKKVKTAADATTASDALKKAVSAIDKAAEHGTIHKNQAARRKSRVAKAANKVAAGS